MNGIGAALNRCSSGFPSKSFDKRRVPYLREGMHLGDLNLQDLVDQSVALQQWLSLKELRDNLHLELLPAASRAIHHFLI